MSSSLISAYSDQFLRGEWKFTSTKDSEYKFITALESEYKFITTGDDVWKFIEGEKQEDPAPSDFSDWFLVSLDELQAMHDNLHDKGIGGFSNGSTPNYWSSSERDSIQGWAFNFDAGGIGSNVKSISFAVRPARTFTASEGYYELGDQTSSGGWVFYIDGTTYYEAAENDISSDYYWSNITDVEIGTTGTGIGDGLSNTAAIIGQSGHLTSAALLCTNYPEVGIGAMKIGSTFIIS